MTRPVTVASCPLCIVIHQYIKTYSIDAMEVEIFIFGANDPDSKYAVLSLIIIILTSFIFTIAANSAVHLLFILLSVVVLMIYISSWMIKRRSQVTFRSKFAESQFIPSSRKATIVYSAFYGIIFVVIFLPACFLAYSGNFESIATSDLYVYLFGFFMGESALFSIVHYIVIKAKG